MPCRLEEDGGRNCRVSTNHPDPKPRLVCGVSGVSQVRRGGASAESGRRPSPQNPCAANELRFRSEQFLQGGACAVSAG